MFFKEALKTIKTTGAVASSSKHLVKRMIAPIDFDNAKIIIEFGAGLGVFTKGLLKNMKPDSKLISYEINDNFFEKLEEIKDDRLVLIKKSVTELKQYVKENNIEKVDYIVSGLPLAIFKKELVDEILTMSHDLLRKGGKYIQFQYSTTSKAVLKKHFGNLKLNFTPLNIPPAFIYACEKM